MGTNMKDTIQQIMAEFEEKFVNKIADMACAFGNTLDPEDVEKSISHMIFKNPQQSSNDYLFLGQARIYLDMYRLFNDKLKSHFHTSLKKIIEEAAKEAEDEMFSNHDDHPSETKVGFVGGYNTALSDYAKKLRETI